MAGVGLDLCLATGRSMMEQQRRTHINVFINILLLREGNDRIGHVQTDGASNSWF